MKKTYSIAGLNVEINGEHTLQQITRLPGFDIFETGNRDENNADIYIYTDKNIDTSKLASIRQIHHSQVLDIKHSFSVCQQGYLYEMYQQDGYRIVGIIFNPYSNEVFMSSSGNNLFIKYAMWVAYTLSAIRKRVIPIHASTIVKDSSAVLFLGESGTGKSTHTGLWLQYIENAYLLNDDSPLLCVIGNKIFVSGSPWSGKTHCYKKDIIPLKALVRLSQYPENKISRSNKLNSIGAIHPSLPPFLAYDDAFSGMMMSIMDKIIDNIPVYEMKCRPDIQAAQIAYTEIY